MNAAKLAEYAMELARLERELPERTRKEYAWYRKGLLDEYKPLPNAAQRYYFLRDLIAWEEAALASQQPVPAQSPALE